jgi:hypothetical protein
MGGRERQQGMLARVGTHDLTSGAAGGNVVRKFCAHDTHNMQRRRTCGLSLW